MEDIKTKYKLHDIYPNARQKNTKYWERLQKVLDASGTRSQNIQLRKKWIERQNLMNYRNEYDRLFGELQHLKPELKKNAIKLMMDSNKLKEIGEYEEEPETIKPETKEEETTTRRRQPNRSKEEIEQEKILKQAKREQKIAEKEKNKKRRYKRKLLSIKS